MLAVAYSPDATRLACVEDNGDISLRDVASGPIIFTVLGRKARPAFSPDGKLLASSGFDNTVTLLDATTGKVLSTLSGHHNELITLAFSPDGKLLASAGDDGTLRLWAVAQ